MSASAAGTAPRRPVRLMVALLVVVALSGCAGGSDDAVTPQSTVEVKKAEPPTGTGGDTEAVGKAVVRGTVLDPSGFVIPKALVVILSVEGSVFTDANGSFIVYGVDPGAQTIRIEKEGYRTVMQSIEVPAGTVVDVEAVLVPSDNLNPGFRNEHVHDLWAGSDQYSFFEGTLSWPSPGPPTVEECGPAGLGALVAPTPRWCAYLDIDPGPGRLIPPGTESFDITVDFAYTPLNTPVAKENVYLYAYPPVEPGEYMTYFQTLRPGETYNILIDPKYQDNGHSAYSGWKFSLYYASGYYPQGATYNALKSDMDVNIVAHKGELFSDPPHPRFWEHNDTIEIPQAVGYGSSTAASSSPRTPWMSYCYESCMWFNQGGIVPPGTTHLEVTFTHWLSYRQAGVDQFYDDQSPDYVLGIKHAGAPRAAATWDDYIFPAADDVEPHESGYGRVLTYRIPLDGMASDQFYDKTSGYVFAVTVPGQEEADTLEMCDYYVCGQYQFIIDAKAINMNRDAHLEAGLA